MLTVIEDGQDTPLVLYERVEDGLFKLWRLYKGETVEQVRALLADEDLPIAYTKRVTIQCLRDMREAERLFIEDGHRERHTSRVVKLLIENRPPADEPEVPEQAPSIYAQFDIRQQVVLEHPEEVGREPNLMIEPLPPALLGALCALRDVHIQPPEEGETPGLPLAGLLPNIWVTTGDGTLHIELGAGTDLTVSESLILEMADVLSNVRDLRGAWQALSQVVAREMPYGGLNFGTPGLTGRLIRAVTRPFRKEAMTLLRTLRWTMSLLGSPLQFVVQTGSTGLLVNFTDGDLSRVDLLEMSADAPLPQEWRRLCADRRVGFVHFIFRLDTTPGAALRDRVEGNTQSGSDAAPPSITLGAQRRIQYYPDNAIANELARHFLGLGMLNVVDLVPDLFAS
ncbi:MAG: hypothetical protein U9R79_07125 [Armatimonadota bacterium]|nr:hypothetical protein [Armatimonadota bacterium]